MFESFVARRHLVRNGDDLRLTKAGQRYFSRRGIDVEQLERGRRPLCRCCLDWSERRSHLSGALGAALFELMLARQWAVREAGTRIVRFAPGGERKIEACFLA